MEELFKDVRVIELANVLAGPSVGMFFAELGAEVIKVENIHTHGDVTRSWKLPKENKEASISAYFSSINWGKKSIALDLKKEKGRSIVYKLIKEADIVVSSYLPGKDKLLGMDAETLLKHNPHLICGEINGYGAEEERAAFDAIIQAEAGFTYLNGNQEQTFKMPVALMDVLAGHQLKEAILLAYIHRLKTGKGTRVHVSLLKSGIAALVNQATNWLQAQHLPQPLGSEHPNIVPYGTQYTCADGSKIVLAIGNDQQFARLCKVLGLNTPEQFTTNTQRVASRAEVHKFLGRAISQEDPITLLEKISIEKIPAAKVADLSQVFSTPQGKSMVLSSPRYKGLKGIAAEGKIFESEWSLAPPPGLSDDADRILSSLGFSKSEIHDLNEQGIVLMT